MNTHVIQHTYIGYSACCLYACTPGEMERLMGDT